MKYTIAIPAYKASFLAICIQSILNQTFFDFELLVVNDASPENIDEVVNRFSDKRIRYYKNEKNCGAINVVDNWNICLSYAKGDYFIMMGDDDELAPNCLEEYNKLMELYPNLDIYHARVKVIDENSDFISLQEARPSYESVYSMIWHRMNGRIQFIGDFLFNTEQLKANGGFYKAPLAWCSDDISTFIAAKNTGIANTDTPIFFYRQNSQTISKTGNVLIKLEAIFQEEKWYSEFLKTNLPSCEMDCYYEIMINKIRNKYFVKKRIFTISGDLQTSFFLKSFYWLIKRKHYSISFPMLVYAIIQSFKIKKSVTL